MGNMPEDRSVLRNVPCVLFRLVLLVYAKAGRAKGFLVCFEQ